MINLPEEQLSKIVQMYRPICNMISLGLVFLFLAIYVVFVSYTLFVILDFYHNLWHNTLLDLCLLLLTLWCSFNILFNYLMSVSTDPGTSFKNISFQLQEVMEICRKCQCKKPFRSHHCSVCSKCIFQMDHHCPWIFNCVGHFNRRYFLNMLTYLALSMNVLLYLNATISSSEQVQYAQPMQIFIITIAVVLNGFSAWHWYIAMKGLTTIQWMQSAAPITKSFNTNLEIIFGSRSLFVSLLPSIRELPWNGIQWPSLQIRSENVE